MSRLQVLVIGVVLMAGMTVSAQTIGGVSDALDPRSAPFNAIPNDGQDDRENLQRWIDAGCASPNKLLYLPPGDWHVTREPIPGVEHAGSLRIACDGLTILGAGRASRIVMKGTAILPDALTPSNWFALEIHGNAVTLEGIAVDGAQSIDTGEQTHLIQITGPARDTELRGLYLHLPAKIAPERSVSCKAEDVVESATRMCFVPGKGRVLCESLGNKGSKPRCSLSAEGAYTVLGWFQGGDCIRSLGEIGPVDGITLTGSFASACDRAFLSAQRHSSNITIAGNVTKRVTDQIIDLEPSGTGSVSNVIVTGNRFERGGASSQGAAAIALTAKGSLTAESILISGNLLDGGILTSRVARVSIEHNVIRGQPSPEMLKPVIQILNRTDSLRLIGNEIERPPAAGAGKVIEVTGDADRAFDVTIALNSIRQGTDADVLHVTGVQDISIVDNMIRCSQLAANNKAAIRASSTPNAEMLARLIVSRNRVRCRGDSLLNIKGLAGAVTVTDNQTLFLNYGVRFADRPGITPRIADNLFQGTPAANFVDGPPGMIFNGENGPLP